jgi:Fe2+ transport system protein FeoA
MRIDIVCIYAKLGSGIDRSSLAMTLGKLKAGSKAIVVAVRNNTQKFVARGIVPGAELSVLQTGDPLAFCLDDGQWAISLAEAEFIDVAVL